MRKIVTVVGARPQFVKIGPVSKKIAQNIEAQEFVIHTGQHFDENMSEIFFQQLQLPSPDVNLGIGGGNHGEQTAKMLASIETILIRERPNLVLVYGDTNSTLAGALAAAKLHIPIAHVEAGLRSFKRTMPEEINRLVTDQLSTLLFTPSAAATGHLLRQGIDSSAIFEVGDVMYDAVLASEKHRSSTEHRKILKRLGLKEDKYLLLTMHRAENTDDDYRLNLLVDELIKLSASYVIVYPMHPRTRLALTRIGRLDDFSKRLYVIEPLAYLETLSLLKNALLLLTDSGGMQKEAMFLKTPCITLRDETEWVETVSAGVNTLYNTNIESLEDLVIAQNRREYNFDLHPYGDGNAAEKISKHLGAFLVRAGDAGLANGSTSTDQSTF